MTTIRRAPLFDYTLPMNLERFASKTTILLLSLLLILAAGCDLLEQIPPLAGDPPATATATATFATTVPDEVEPPVVEPATPTPEPPAAAQRTLTVWLPPEISGRTQNATSVLNEQIRVFTTAYPDVQVVVHQKSVSGPGGMLSYLRTGRGVAPAILPDLMVLPGDRLLTTYSEELIYPLGTSAGGELFEALYPAAQQVARPQDIILGYPFALTNMPHLAYDTAVITGTFPISFTQMLDLPNSTLLYPGSGTEGVAIWLQLYLAYEGRLVSENGQPTLETEPLRLALAQLNEARQRGFITSQSSNVATVVDAWQIFEEGGATIVQTSAGQFLRARSPQQAYGFAAVPGLDDALPPLVDSWVWTVSTADPVRRGLALDLITFLVQPENLGEWSQAANILPARSDALVHWGVDDPYVQFLDQQLRRAQPNPVAPGSQLLTVFRDAVFDVTSLAESPGAAATNAAAIFD
jgi:ABC-type glycerol-3-phosphate transport system substrate-binding protein